MDPALVVQLVFGLLDRAVAIKTLIETAQKEGRDITPQELQKLFADDDLAREKLLEEIRAKGGTT